MKLIKGFFMLVGGGITLLIVLGVIGTMMQSPEEREAPKKEKPRRKGLKTLFSKRK